MNWIFSQTDFSTPTLLIAGLSAIAFVGLAKGGLAGFGLLGVPILALFMPPLQAAALLLPSFLVMDAIALVIWRNYKDWSIIRAMLPAAIIGIVIGALMASMTSDAMVKLMVGVVTLSFVLRQTLMRWQGKVEPVEPNETKARIWGAVSGFTSFIAHAGSPPFQVYVLPLRLDPKIVTGTATIFFTVVNLIKAVPYFILGEFDEKTLTSTFVLIPVAVVFVYIGALIVKRMDARVFYPFTYSMIFGVSLKLIWDGLGSL